MRVSFQPYLVNGTAGDPALFVDFTFQKRALLFDLGALHTLAPRKILRITDAFVSHTHVDHFIGFDWLLRIRLGRERCLRLFGPPGFLAQVEHKLHAYTWNLVRNYRADFSLQVHEIAPQGIGRRAWFHCRSAFRREQEEAYDPADGILLAEPGFLVRGTFLDHGTPCLAYSLEEQRHLNIWKNRLLALGVGAGPWLRDFKQAVLAGLPDDTRIRARWRDAAGVYEREFSLGSLREEILRVSPGQKIAYVTDAVYHAENAARIVALARGADELFIESPFLDSNAPRAAQRGHLTARQAGELARLAGTKRASPFHFSPVHALETEALQREFAQAYAGPAGTPTTGEFALPDFPDHN